MIRFSLVCGKGHEFDGWFRDGADFERLASAHLTECPHCGDKSVGKALMTPAVRPSKASGTVSLGMGEEQKRVLTELKALSDKMRAESENVGPRFAEEARKIHYGESAARGIYGEATAEEAKSLSDEGVPVLPLPVFPDEAN